MGRLNFIQSDIQAIAPSPFENVDDCSIRCSRFRRLPLAKSQELVEQPAKGELGRVCIDSLQICDPLFELSPGHLAIDCAQAVFMALMCDPFYAVIIAVDAMTVETRDIGDFGQELPRTLLLFSHAQRCFVKTQPIWVATIISSTRTRDGLSLDKTRTGKGVLVPLPVLVIDHPVPAVRN
jgi:hypothetical protein